MKLAHGEDYPRLKNFIALGYIVLLEAIASGDKNQIRQVCEGNLYKSFSEGLDELSFSTKEIMVLNKPDFELDERMDKEIDELFDVEVVDMEQIFGVSIDRETNSRISFNPV